VKLKRGVARLMNECDQLMESSAEEKFEDTSDERDAKIGESGP
jgi:hypothetical protein